jgi:hypothetical protein
MSQPYHFTDPENTACITCCHVLERTASILHVTHDEDDGGWQFLCGADGHTMEHAKVLSMCEIVEIDPSVNGLHGMPQGVGAYREKVGGEWTPFRLQRGED